MRCTHCLSELPDRLGYETPAGDALCGPCYFSLWGPRGGALLMSATERRRPTSRRAKRRLPWMVPGPSGELDPEEPLRRARLYRQAKP